jgi:hypothetical protein
MCNGMAHVLQVSGTLHTADAHNESKFESKFVKSTDKKNLKIEKHNGADLVD